MKTFHSRVPGLKFWPLLPLLAATVVPSFGTNLLTATPSSISITCSTTTGPGAATNVVIKPLGSVSGSIVVTFTPVTGLVVTAPSITTITSANASAGLTYSVKTTNGCAGTVSGANTLQFLAGGVSDISATVTVAITGAASASPLTATPSPVVFYCVRTPGLNGNPATYSAGSPQTVAVKSATPGGTPFTVNTTTFAAPSWLTVSNTSGGTATTSAVNLTLTLASGCGGFNAATVTTVTLHLTNAPSNDKLVQVSLHVVSPNALTATPSPASLSYVKGSGSPGNVAVAITSTNNPAPFFTVDTTTLPIWLNVDATTGTVPKSLHFTTTSAADAMAPGTYSATVHLQVSNYADLTVPVTLLLNNPAPKLTVAEGLTRTLNWTVGTPLPTPLVTAVSSDAPIPYTVTTGGTLAPIVSAANLKDLAYSIGTPIPVTFDPTIFAAAVPGSALTGTVTLTWGNPSTATTVTFSVNIVAPGATLTAVSPASLPTAAPGVTFTLALTGTNFVGGSDPTLRTKVGVVSAVPCLSPCSVVVDPSITVNVVNPSNIILTVLVPATASANLPFSPTGAGGTVILGVCNPGGTACSTPTGTMSFAIGGAPIIQSLSSSSSFVQTAPAVPTVAPYDLVSVFGSSFCSSGGTGCATSDLLRGSADPVTLAYPQFLTPDPSSAANPRLLTAVFQTHATPPVVIATAPLLFATNSQINLVVPAALAANSGTSVDLVVNFGYGTGATMLSSAPFAVNVLDTDPGIFTVTGDGQGLGAVLNYTTSAPIVPGAEAGMRSTGTDSDVVRIFMTGLGVPNSTASNGSAGASFAYSADCISAQSYLDTLNSSTGSSLTALDGLVISSSLLNSKRLPPCFVTGTASAKPTVTVGGVTATVTYAGWVPDSIAGQYEVDVTLPASGAGSFTTAAGTTVSAITTPVQLPIVVTAATHSSQAGVLMWVTRKLKVTAPTGAGLTGPVGVAWSSSNNVVAATEGTAPYRYAVTSGLLPAGLTLSASTGAISGIPAANTSGSYLVTVTATDSANFPVSDQVSFTITVTGGLVLSNTGTAPFHEVFSTADAAMSTVTATGGLYPYTYALSGPASAPAGLTVDPAAGVVGVSATVPAGTYHMAVTATDSTTGTALTGTVNFDAIVALNVVNSTPQAGAHGTASTITTVSATGGTGAVTYALDSASAALSWLAIDANTGAVTITTGAPSSTTKTVTVTATAGSTATGAAVAGTGSVTFTLTIS